MSPHENLLGGPPATFLPDHVEPRLELEDGADAYDVVRRHPTASLAWADLADQAWNEGRVMESYAFARVGYHRGLDALRRNGWKGFGSVPWEHQPNQGFLRCVFALQRAAESINEADEAQRCVDFLIECDPVIIQVLRA
ncbi:MAG: DUF3151 domain-containing protein [Actinomycetes bacterium]